MPAFEKSKRPERKTEKKRELKPGDEVKVLTFGQKGRRLRKPARKNGTSKSASSK